MEDIIRDVQSSLESLGDEAVRQSSRRFFKESVCVHGVKSADVKNIASRTFKRIKERSPEEVYALCESLWQSGYLEEGGVACEWSYALRSRYRSGDLSVFAGWLNAYVSNWASCDTLCNHTIGSFLERYPEQVSALLDWTASENRWMKRGAAVSLIVPARKGMFLEDAMRIADRLMADPDDLVQKGWGWMLKAASEVHPDEVFAYLMRHRTVMPRTAFRYALEKLPREQRDLAMGKSAPQAGG